MPFAVFVAVGGTVETGPDNYSFKIEDLPFVFLLVFVLAYFFVLEAFNGQTIGKRWQSLEVVTATGSDRPGLGAIAGRTVLRLIDWLPGFYLAGYITIRNSKKRMRLGDMAAKTRVVPAVKERQPRMAPGMAIAALLAIGAVTLVGAGLTTNREETAFVNDADELCEGFNLRANELAADLNGASSADEAVALYGQLSDLLAEAATGLAALDPPSSIEAMWKAYATELRAYVETLNETRAALASRKMAEFRQLQAEIFAPSQPRFTSLDDLGFSECG